MAAARASDVAQAASGALVGAIAPLVGGPEVILWLLAAMGVCSLGDALAPAARSRWHLAARYLSSVSVTLAASYAAAAWVWLHHPEWRDHIVAVRIGAALVTGIALHPIIAAMPSLVDGVRDILIAGVQRWTEKRK